MLTAALTTGATDIKFIRDASPVLTGLIFFEREEAGLALQASNISVTTSSIIIAIALRKNQTRVALTLEYKRDPAFIDSVVDTLLHYDSFQLNERP